MNEKQRKQRIDLIRKISMRMSDDLLGETCPHIKDYQEWLDLCEDVIQDMAVHFEKMNGGAK